MRGFGKIALNSGWFWIRYQFFIIMDLIFGAAALNLVTKSKIFLRALGSCFSATFLLSKFISATVLVIKVSGQPLFARRTLKLVILLSNCVFEEQVL